MGIRSEVRRLSRDRIQDARPRSSDVAQWKDFSQRFRTLTSALEALPDDTAIDGEVVALDGTGRPSFNLLQNHISSNYSLVFYVFDLLMLAGADLSRECLEVRRDVL
jgi:bifunctional non-homologous end joining protein LigD